MRMLDRRTMDAAAWRETQWRRLDFCMQHQQQSNWCWAAVATSVALFFDPASTWTQCEVANRHCQRTDCCDPGQPNPCNQRKNLQGPLGFTGHLDPPFIARAARFGEVETRVDAATVVCARTVWSGNRGAHFVAIIGYLRSFDMLAVDDPLYGKSDVDYATFCTDYHNAGGTWSHTFFTRP